MSFPIVETGTRMTQSSKSYSGEIDSINIPFSEIPTQSMTGSSPTHLVQKAPNSGPQLFALINR